MKQSWQLFSAFGEGVERCHPCRDALENADVVSDVADDDAALFPLTDNLGIKGFFPRVAVRPERLYRSGNFGGFRRF